MAEFSLWPGIKGRVALVTGASRGIGRAIARALGLQGAVVIGTATTQEGADAISQRLKTEGLNGRGLVLDVSDPTSIDALFAELAESDGAPTILVNNAGITRDNLLIRMREEDWDQVISTNLSSLYRVCKAALRGMMKARGGRIIIISSEINDELEQYSDHIIQVPKIHHYLQPILTTIPLQLLAYHIALLRGCNVDRPRNLAKSVTVE